MNEADAKFAYDNVKSYHTFQDFVREGMLRPEVLAWIHTSDPKSTSSVMNRGVAHGLCRSLREAR